MFLVNKRMLYVIFMVIMMLAFSGCSGPDKVTTIGDDRVQEDINLISEQPEIEENLVRCPLSGDMVPEGTTDRRPLAVMIENAPAARPQSGLDKADVVYEISAEGAITRFLAIYLHGDTGQLGPVRSARPYYIERMLEYDAMYAFCGGSEAAKKMIRTAEVASLDEFGIGSRAYHRIKGRKAPHNLYADTEKLRKVGAGKGYEKVVKLPEFTFLEPGKDNPGGVTADSVTVNYLKSYSKVRWDFDPERKVYLRFQGGSAHRDGVTGKQLTGTNILIQYANTKVIDNEGRLEITMVGKGQAILVTDGRAYMGSWAKKSMRAQTFFYGEDGQVFMLNPGQTWIEVVPLKTKIEF